MKSLKETIFLKNKYRSLPLSAVLDNTVMSDGGEKLSAFANIFEIVSNVVLSIVLGKLINDENSIIGSFRQYVVESLVTSIENNEYVTTTGYNRYEYLITDNH